MCLSSPMWLGAVKQRSYKMSGRRQYHSPSSGGSREGRNVDRLETAEFLRMALDELGLSICGSWETDGETGKVISAHFTMKKSFTKLNINPASADFRTQGTANCQRKHNDDFWF